MAERKKKSTAKKAAKRKPRAAKARPPKEQPAAAKPRVSRGNPDALKLGKLSPEEEDRQYQVDPYSALILVESPNKCKSVRKAVEIGIKGGDLDIPADFRVEATVGHFRTLFDLTPYSEPPGAEVWPRYARETVKEKRIAGDPTVELCRKVGDINEFVAAQLDSFFRSHPATPGVVSSNPDPEINPGRYLGVDIDSHGRPVYWPNYWIPSVQLYRKLEGLLVSLRGNPPRIYLATDRDREGEGIAWHVTQAFANLLTGVDVRRMRFGSTAPGDIIAAIQEADEAHEKGEPAIDARMVAAYVAREVLDRLIGYPGSRALWRLNENRNLRMKAIKMGRVKFAALGLLLRAEEEAMQSLPSISYQVDVEGMARQKAFPLSATSGRPFDDPKKLAAALNGTPGTVGKTAGPTVSRKRMPMYHLARLQNEVEREFRIRPARTMAVAQELFEGALITYHRTDSDKPSGAGFGFLKTVARDMKLIGPSEEPTFPFFTTSANAQEGHEALRPVPSAVVDRFVSWWKARSKQSKSRFHQLKDVWFPYGHRNLSEEELKIFELIMRRSLGALLDGPEVESRSVVVEHPALAPYESALTGTSKTIGDEGYLVIWSGFSRLTVPAATKHTLPDLAVGETVKIKADAKQFGVNVTHPRRASLVGFAGKLADEGIGRPATNTRMLQDLEEAGYVQAIELDPVTGSGAPVVKDDEGREKSSKGGKRSLKTAQPGMSRYGAFIANLARHAFSKTLSIGTTKEMEDSLDELLETDPKALLDRRVQILGEYYGRFTDQLGYARHLCSRYGGGESVNGRGLPGFLCAADGQVPGIATIAGYLENTNDRLTVIEGTSADADDLVLKAAQTAFSAAPWEARGSVVHYGRSLTDESQTGAWLGVWRPTVKGKGRKKDEQPTAVVRTLLFYLDPESEPPARTLVISSNVDLEAPVPCRPLVSQFVHLHRIKSQGINLGDHVVRVENLKFVAGETNVAAGVWSPNGHQRKVAVLLGHFGQRVSRPVVDRFRQDGGDYDDLIVAAAEFSPDAHKPTVTGPPVYLVAFPGAEQGNGPGFELPARLDDPAVMVEDPAAAIAHRILEHVEIITMFRMRNLMRMRADAAWEFLIEQWQLAARRYGPKYAATIFDRNAAMADMIRYDGRHSVASLVLGEAP